MEINCVITRCRFNGKEGVDLYALRFRDVNDDANKELKSIFNLINF